MLGNEHFLEVQQLIWNARASYENLGIALGLVYVDIVDIKQTHHYNTENCFNAVLVEVLNQGVTQEDLANALESKTVHEGQLAKKVRATTFSSSKLPVFMGPPSVRVYVTIIST